MAAWDPLRVVVDVRGTGQTGYEVANIMRESYDVHVELATHATIVLVLGLRQPADDLERFAHDLAESVARMEPATATVAPLEPPATLLSEIGATPRDAFLGEAETVAVEQAVGRISCESIAGYPPGIPALLPGERITAELVAYLQELSSAGARLHGASDPTFRSVNVLREG